MSFEAAYRDHRAGVLRFARMCGRGRIDSEEALSETFLIAWQIWPRRRSENIRAWLLGITRNVVRRMLRAQRRSLGVTLEPWSPEADRRVQPPTQEQTAQIAQLRSRFDRFGPAQAAALHGIADGLTPSEIAERAGGSAAAVRMALSLGRRRLREMAAGQPALCT